MNSWRPALSIAILFFSGIGPDCLAEAKESEDDFLSWSEKEAVEVGKRMRVDGRVGGFFDGRIIHTEQSYNYRLRATWLTPEVIRASARLAQLREYLTDEETLGLVTEAEAAGDTVVLVEIDPQEGSGVIPRGWTAVLRPKTDSGDGLRGVRGSSKPKLQRVKALAGTLKRDYAYDIFWVVFPLVAEDGAPLFPPSSQEAELFVRIYNKEGKVDWPITQTIRARMEKTTTKKRR